MKEYMELFWAFARIGGLTFGGGLTMLPMLTYELVDKKGWVTEEELMDCYAIGQCTPGIIAVNTATFIGYKKKGVMGGIVATLGMVAPSLLIITIIAMFLTKYMSHPMITNALNGIRGAVCALMLNTVVQLARKSLVDLKCVVIGVAVLLLSLLTEVPTVVLVAAAAVAGVLIWKVEGRRS